MSGVSGVSKHVTARQSPDRPDLNSQKMRKKRLQTQIDYNKDDQKQPQHSNKDVLSGLCAGYMGACMGDP